MSGHGNVVGNVFREVSVEEVSCRVNIHWGTILGGSVSLSSIYKEVSVEELSECQFISAIFSEELL